MIDVASRCVPLRPAESRQVPLRPGYSGAYQFIDSTFREVTGLPGRAVDYGPAIQDAAALELAESAGWGQWPVSSRLCGLG